MGPAGGEDIGIGGGVALAGGLGGCSVSEFVEYYQNEPSTSVDSVVWL